MEQHVYNHELLVGFPCLCPVCKSVASYERTFIQPGPFNDLIHPDPDFDGWQCEECDWEHEATDADYRYAEQIEKNRDKMLAGWRERLHKFTPHYGTLHKQKWFTLMSGFFEDRTPSDAEVAIDTLTNTRWITHKGHTSFAKSIAYEETLSRTIYLPCDEEPGRFATVMLKVRRTEDNKLGAALALINSDWGILDDPDEENECWAYDETDDGPEEYWGTDLELESVSWEDFSRIAIEYWHRSVIGKIEDNMMLIDTPEHERNVMNYGWMEWHARVAGEIEKGLLELEEEKDVLMDKYENREAA